MNTLARTAWVVLLPVALATGCPDSSGNDGGDDGGAADAAVLDGGTADAAVRVDAGPPVRDVVQNATQFGRTSVDNLLQDPLFRAVYSSSYAFIPLAQSATSVDYAYATPFESATPPQAPGATIKVPDANSKLVVLSMFNGGKGPFWADVWATTITDDDVAVEDGSGVQVQVGEAWIFDGNGAQVYELDLVPGDNTVINGVPWFHYAGRIAKDLPTTSVFALTTLDKGRHMLVAGPQVVPEVLRPTPAPRVALPVPQARASHWHAEMAPALERLHQAAPRLDSPRKAQPRVWKTQELRRLP